MTNEQEQIVLKMLSKLADVKLLIHGERFECFFCTAEWQWSPDFFHHTPDCPVLLAHQLQEMLKGALDNPA